MTIDALCTEPLVPPSRLVDGYPRRLEEICLRALARDRSERYATAAEMRKELLEVTRALPEATESLASLMQRIFADRIVEKNEMLRRVGNGGDITRVPANETDDGVDVPNVTQVAPIAPPPPQASTGAPTDVPALPGTSRATPPASPRRRERLALLLVSLVAGIGIVLASRAILRARSARLATTTVAPAAVAEAVKPVEVSVRIETKPPGARVAIGGSDRGDTPLDLRLPAGDVPLRIDLHRSGYRALSQTVVPNRDQMLVLSMQPVAAPVVRSPTRAPQPAPPVAAPSGFRRFD
jgi:serine/threonine-protein kinase